jgi:hypothetical protein
MSKYLLKARRLVLYTEYDTLNFDLYMHLIYSYNYFAVCASVLLPARVVQALNINVHALGVQVSPPKGMKTEF